MSQTEAVPHTDSIETQDPSQEEPKKTKSRRPANTAFRQQRLKAWQPILTPKTVLPLFFAVGILFAPIGGLLLWASNQVEQISIDYSGCEEAPLAPAEFGPIPSGRVTSDFHPTDYKSSPPTWQRNDTFIEQQGVNISTRICSLQFDISNDLKPPVLFYYRLTDFYQNHRRYVKSLDASQLTGDARTYDQLKGSDCDPLAGNETSKKPYYPCGLIANSFFNDSFNAPLKMINKQDYVYEMTTKNIAWESDRELYKPTKYKPEEVDPPPNWRARYPDGYTADQPIPELQNDEAFHVWMRTAGLPTFSKLALRNDTGVMVRGRYQIDVYDHFNVTLYGGTKSILISTRTVMGGRNHFLGIAYIVVGIICVALGGIFTVTHLFKPRKLGDHTYLTWNSEPSTATATGRSIRPGT